GPSATGRTRPVRTGVVFCRRPRRRRGTTTPRTCGGSVSMTTTSSPTSAWSPPTRSATRIRNSGEPPVTTGGSVVLSTLEFDMLWEAERLPRRHPALDVPSAGITHSERADLVEQAWDSLAQRRLAKGHQATSDLVDMLNLFVRPAVAIDSWVWTDRQISGLAVSTGTQALMGVVDGDEVWLIPARDSSLPESAVSVAGETPAGVGWSASVPHDILVEADREAAGDARALVGALTDRGIVLSEAQEFAAMLMGQVVRGQFGAQTHGR